MFEMIHPSLFERKLFAGSEKKDKQVKKQGKIILKLNRM